MTLLRLEEEPAATAAGALDPHLLIGTWFNTNQMGPGIQRIVLSADPPSLGLEVYAQGIAAPETWGRAVAQPFAETVNAGEAMSFYAEYRFQNLGVRLQGYVVKGVLVIVSFVDSTAPDLAPGYMTKEFFYRVAR